MKMKTIEIPNKKLRIRKSVRKVSLGSFLVALLFILVLSVSEGCHKDQHHIIPASLSFDQVNLVSDTIGFNADRVDHNLNNAWGIAFGPNGNLYISSNHRGLAVVYDKKGKQAGAPIAIPFNGDPNGSSPTGAIYNTTSDFNGAHVIFSTEDGIISGWTSGSSSVTLADRSSSNAIYKGLTIASDGGSNFIYATDFHNAKVDVFDKSMNYVTSKPFSDPSIPAGFAPFNIQNFDNFLYVTYAKQKPPDFADDTSGVGNGYVNIFKTDGTLVKRFASQGTLNSPWGITQTENEHGNKSGNILIGNFGDGFINVFDASGKFKRQLSHNGIPISINGLWDIAFPPKMGHFDDNELIYFTAGPDGEAHGIFGFLSSE